METLKSSQILYRQSLSISSWLPILEKMNTFYVENGSIINKSRYDDWKKMNAEQQSEIVELFLVKWRVLSHLHCSWESENDLIAFEGPHMKQKFQVGVVVIGDG